MQMQTLFIFDKSDKKKVQGRNGTEKCYAIVVSKDKRI